MDALIQLIVQIEQYGKAGTVIVGLFAVGVAIISVWTNRRNAAETATINFINDLSTEKELARGQQILRLVRHNLYQLDRLIELANPVEQAFQLTVTEMTNEADAVQDDFEAILALLNYFENMAIGARIGILDMKTLRMSRRKQIINTWNLLEPFIMALREQDHNPCIYEHFEWLKNCMVCEARLSRCRPWKCDWLKCTWFRRFTRRCPCKD